MSAHALTFPAAKRSSIVRGLRDTLATMNMLALDGEEPRARLVVRWHDVRTPFVISSRGQSTATLSYELRRISNDELLFQREITTTVEGQGSNASMRVDGTVRAAIAANFASIAYCLDKAPSGNAPQDCALNPRYKVLVRRVDRRGTILP